MIPSGFASLPCRSHAWVMLGAPKGARLVPTEPWLLCFWGAHTSLAPSIQPQLSIFGSQTTTGRGLEAITRAQLRPAGPGSAQGSLQVRLAGVI